MVVVVPANVVEEIEPFSIIAGSRIADATISYLQYQADQITPKVFIDTQMNFIVFKESKSSV